MSKQPEISRKFILTGADSNAEGYISMHLLGARIISVASEHANSLGIGYDDLVRHGIGWVLGRLSIELFKMPRMNQEYCLTTWIESYNRRFSNRNMALTNGDATELFGYVRTQWMTLNFNDRSGADLSELGVENFPTLDRECPIDRPRRIVPPGPDALTRSYTFGYTDIDFNRHVDTVRYIDLLMDCHSLDWHDHWMPGRLDVAFHHECLYGQEATVRFTPGQTPHTDYEILVGEQRAVSAAIDWKPQPDR